MFRSVRVEDTKLVVELQQIFEDVGLMTGETSVDADASCLVTTTENTNMAYVPPRRSATSYMAVGQVRTSAGGFV